MKIPNIQIDTTPVVIGGIGGSGTRLIADCLTDLGFFMGYDLNQAFDNLWFALLFTRAETLKLSNRDFGKLVDILIMGIKGRNDFTEEQVSEITKLALLNRDRHSRIWLDRRAASLLSKKPNLAAEVRWGWKAPNSHVFLDRLDRHIQGLKYIHVTRNGLDMAHSKNQSQLRLWGQSFIGEEATGSPYYSLKFWCISHKRVIKTGTTMGKRFLLFNYDRFCSHPQEGIETLATFLNLDIPDNTRRKLLKKIHPPDSIGRFRQYGTKIFDEGDIAYVRELGFDTARHSDRP